MATRFNHALTPAMIALLRWYAHAPAERKRRWKQRPHPNRAQKLALVARGLVTSREVPLSDYDIIEEAFATEPDRITTEGRQLLKMIDKNPRAWMPK